MLIGSAIGAATSKNPLQGALMGGMLGGAGSAFMGGTSGLSSLLSGTGSTASGVLPSALSGSTTINANALPTGAVQAFTTGAPTATPLNVEAMKSAGSGLFAPPAGGFQSLTAGMPQPLTYNQATAAGMQRPLSLGMPGVEASSLYEPTFMDRLGSVGQYAQQNPYLTQMGMQSAQQMMQQPQAQFAPAGQIQRGGIQDVQIASALPQAPRISLI
jgi:hypothetical protein